MIRAAFTVFLYGWLNASLIKSGEDNLNIISGELMDHIAGGLLHCNQRIL